jgi:hypothetical protein
MSNSGAQGTWKHKERLSSEEKNIIIEAVKNWQAKTTYLQSKNQLLSMVSSCGGLKAQEKIYFRGNVSKSMPNYLDDGGRLLFTARAPSSKFAVAIKDRCLGES